MCHVDNHCVRGYQNIAQHVSQQKEFLEAVEEELAVWHRGGFVTRTDQRKWQKLSLLLSIIIAGTKAVTVELFWWSDFRFGMKILAVLFLSDTVTPERCQIFCCWSKSNFTKTKLKSFPRLWSRVPAKREESIFLRCPPGFSTWCFNLNPRCSPPLLIWIYCH